mgnify:CR=1 FL=1
MFEPVHGTAPDIALKGIANPFAAVLTGRIMLDTLGHKRPAELIWAAVQSAVIDALAPFGIRHLDMPATPERVWRAIQEAKAG